MPVIGYDSQANPEEGVRVILRIVRGFVAPERSDALVDAFRARRAELVTHAGLLRYHVAWRQVDEGGHELLSMTVWESAEAAIREYGDLNQPRSLGGLDELAEGTTASFYELDESMLRETGADRGTVRYTAGVIPFGSDVDIQLELRRRMPGIGSEMTEGYVGRRIVGDSVEVAFVSVWQVDRPGQPLDQPLWRDLSTRYSSFEIATFALLDPTFGAATV